MAHSPGSYVTGRHRGKLNSKDEGLTCEQLSLSRRFDPEITQCVWHILSQARTLEMLKLR